MRTNFCFYLLLSLNFLVHAQQPVDRYNLDFNPTSITNFLNWRSSPKNIFLFGKDVTTNPSSFYAANMLMGKKNMKVNRLHGFIEQTITLPLEAKALKVNFRCKSKFMNYLSLIVYRLDNQQQILSCDTINSIDQKEMATYSKNFDVNGAKLLHLQVDFKESEGDSLSKMWIESVGLFIDGKDLRTLPQEKSVIALNHKELKPIKDLLNGNVQLAEFDKRILGIGETVHNCDGVRKMANEILKYGILHKGYQHVLTEYPFDLGLLFNQYLSDPNLQLPSDSAWIKKHAGISDMKGVLEFLSWLKTYNDSRPNKVKFWSIDISESSRCVNNLLEYITLVKQKCPHPSLDSLQVTLSNGNKECLQKAASFLAKHRELATIFPKGEYRLLTGMLQQTFETETKKSAKGRDCIMFENTETILEANPTDKVLIYAHLAHVGHSLTYTDIFSEHSLGRFLKDKYPQDYSCVALLINKGYSKMIDLEVGPMKLCLKPLKQPIPFSLESELGKFCKNGAWYLPTSALSPDEAYVRFMGAIYYETQFVKTWPKYIADLVIYIVDEGF